MLPESRRIPCLSRKNCLFLPESVGAQRLSGAMNGKWYRQTLLEAMRVAEISLAFWTPFGNGNSDDLRLATRRVALWYRPMHPRQNADIPNREAE